MSRRTGGPTMGRHAAPRQRPEPETSRSGAPSSGCPRHQGDDVVTDARSTRSPSVRASGSPCSDGGARGPPSPLCASGPVGVALAQDGYPAGTYGGKAASAKIAHIPQDAGACVPTGQGRPISPTWTASVFRHPRLASSREASNGPAGIAPRRVPSLAWRATGGGRRPYLPARNPLGRLARLDPGITCDTPARHHAHPASPTRSDRVQSAA